MRLVKAALSIFLVLCLFSIEEGGISSVSQKKSEISEAPVITDIQLRTKKIIAGKENKLKFQINYSDFQKDLAGGKLQLDIREVYGASSKQLFSLTGSKFSQSSGRGLFKTSVKIGNSQCILMDFTLIDASGNKSQVYRLAKEVNNTIPLYDDFDGKGGFQEYRGKDFAEKGQLSKTLWAGDGKIKKNPGVGNVLELSHNGKGEDRHTFLFLASPRQVKLSEIKSVSFDLMVPSSNTSTNFGGGIRFHSSLNEKYYHMQFGFWSDSKEINLSGYWNNHTTDENKQTDFVRVAPDSWHNVRIDILKVKKNLVTMAFYVDGKKIYQGVANLGFDIENTDKLDWGPERALVVYNGDPGTKATAYFDNVHAEYVHDTRPIPNTSPLYDDFDGNGCYQNQDGINLAEKGDLGREVWAGEGQISEENGRGYVANISMKNGETEGKKIYLINPAQVVYKDFSSFSADVMLPSRSKCKGYSAQLSLESAYTIGSEKVYWWIDLGLNHYGDRYHVYYSTKNFDGADSKYFEGPAVKPDTWYNLRIDADKLADSRTKLTYYLDDRYLYDYVADENKVMMGSDLFEGYRRSLGIWKNEAGKEAIANFDNVRSDYRQIVRVAQIAPLYDDFDGHGGQQNDGSQLARAGEISSQLWRGLGRVVSAEDHGLKDAEAHGYVYNFEADARHGDMLRFALVHPENIDFQDYLSFSADVMLSSKSTWHDFGIGLDYHTSIPEQPPGASWYGKIGLSVRDNQLPSINVLMANKNTGYRYDYFCGSASWDRWYNLRVDITKMNSKQVRFDFYVNNVWMTSEIPEDSEILLDPKRLLFGPKRSFDVHTGREDTDGIVIVYIDNVRAVYTKQ